MAMKSRHAFGSKANVINAIEQGLIDAFDVLFLDGENETPSIGWVDKDGNPVYVPIPEDTESLKALIEELEAQMATKEQMTSLENQVADVENVLDNYLLEEYEISHKPSGTIVDYRDKEIRVLCPVNTKFELQQSGEGSESDLYYIGFKAYAPNEDVVSFKEELSDTISDTTMYYFENNEFAGIDSDGRKYSIVWLPVAKYDVNTDTWTYYGASSSSEGYIGWYYSVEWYNVDGILVASDCIRINLTNEACHSLIKPFYMVSASQETETKIEEATAEATKNANAYTDEQIANAISVIEF